MSGFHTKREIPRKVVKELSSCKQCHTIVEEGVVYCNKCMSGDYNEYREVREFLYQNPNSSALDVSRATGVKVRTIMDLLNKGKISINTEKSFSNKN